MMLKGVSEIFRWPLFLPSGEGGDRSIPLFQKFYSNAYEQESFPPFLEAKQFPFAQYRPDPLPAAVRRLEEAFNSITYIFSFPI